MPKWGWAVLVLSILSALLVFILVPTLLRSRHTGNTTTEAATTTVASVVDISDVPTHVSPAFCKEIYDLGLMSPGVAASKLCQLGSPEELAMALDCENLTPELGKDLMNAGACFEGFAGEELYLHLMTISEPFRDKYEGPCDDDCDKIKAEALHKVKKVEEETESAVEDAIELTDRTAVVLKDVERLVWAEKEASNNRDGLLLKLETKINGTDLPPTTKTHLVKQIRSAMEFAPEILTSYEDIIAAVNKEIGTLNEKKIDLQEKKSFMRKQFGKTKRYLQSQSKTKLLGKVGSAMDSVSTSIKKFSSGEPAHVISGILDVTTAISEFLPTPANAIMGPISSIFNGIFGIGGGPSIEDVIKEEFEKQKVYLEGEFKKLNEKIDDLRKEIRQAAIDELVAEQKDTRKLLDDLLAYLSVFKDDDRITEAEALAASAQVTPALTGSRSDTEGKTDDYLEKYCKGRQAGDLSTAKSCIGLIHSFTMTYSMRQSVLARFIALLRTSDLGKNAEANVKMLDKRRKRLKDFLNIFLRDRTPHCQGGYRIYGCLASGEALSLEAAPIQSYGSYVLPDSQRLFLRDLTRTLGDSRPFASCDPSSLRVNYDCGQTGRAILLTTFLSNKYRYWGFI